MDLNEFKKSIPSYIEQAKNICSGITNGNMFMTPTISSMDELDMCVEFTHDLWTKKQISDDMAWELSVVFGVFLGEMIIDEHGLQWMVSNDLLVVGIDEENWLSPITKIYKIITGDEDVAGKPSSFYDAFLALQQYQDLCDKGDIPVYTDEQEQDV